MECASRTQDLAFTGRQSNKKLGHHFQQSKSKHAQYFTPGWVSDAIFEGLKKIVPEDRINDLSVLDPNCGSGRLLLPWKKAGSQVVGVELDTKAFDVAKRVLGAKAVRLGDTLDYAQYLNGFDLCVANPPYGIYWDVKDKDLPFDCECYGGSIESQTATIEIITKALGYSGLLVLIIPTSMFTNSKDKKFREHLYQNYKVISRITCEELFKLEYGIDVEVDIVLAKSQYCGGCDTEAVKINCKTKNSKTTIAEMLQDAVLQNDISTYPSRVDAPPQLDRLKTTPVENTVFLKEKGAVGNLATTAHLDFLNHVQTAFNPVTGTTDGIINAYCSPSTLITRGIEESQTCLERMGFQTSVSETDRKKIESLRQKYEFLATPLRRPKPHQLIGYYEEREYEAEKNVKGLFTKGAKYQLHPSWVRNRETTKTEVLKDKKDKEYTQKTEVDRGYISIKVQTDSGERVFTEISLDDVKLFTKAFPLPEIQDVADKYPKLVNSHRKKVEKLFPFLFKYQKDDLSRLATKPNGYVGYEMGGGKTVTSAVWAALRGYKKVLVVCQSGLVENWINELTKFGFNAQRLTTHRSIDKLKQNGKVENTTFYVTSYEFLSLDTQRVYEPWDCIEYDKDGNIRREEHGITKRSCPKCHRKFENVVRTCPNCEEFEKWTGKYCHACGFRAYKYTKESTQYPAYKRVKKMFSAVIVDEAQMAKTKNSARGRAIRSLKSKGKLILTGTIMKGYITDVFWNVGWLLGFDNPQFHYAYRGGSKRFLDEFGTYEYVTKQFEDTLSEGRAKMIPEVSNLNRFWKLMGSFTIRRTKDTMIKLPPKKREVEYLPMDAEHAKLYSAYEMWAKDTIRDAMMKAKDGANVNMGVISGALWKLRFVATVPTAKDNLTNGSGPGRYLNRNGEGWNKLNQLVELVREIQAKGEKVIIFSGLRPMVSRIITTLRSNGIGFMPILAKHKASQRFQMIQEFTNSNTTAIVTGLNVLNRGFTITAANHVIFTDLDYTPEAVQQAEDRAHRTGQTKEVNVHYLLSNNTIDQVMHDITQQKAKAISHAIDGKAQNQDVANLLRKSSGSIEMEIAERLVELPDIQVPVIHEVKLEEPKPTAELILRMPEMKPTTKLVQLELAFA